MFFLDPKCFFEPKISLDQTISRVTRVPRTNVAWTYVSGKVLPRAYSNSCSNGNKHFKNFTESSPSDC